MISAIITFGLGSFSNVKYIVPFGFVSSVAPSWTDQQAPFFGVDF